MSKTNTYKTKTTHRSINIHYPNTNCKENININIISSTRDTLIMHSNQYHRGSCGVTNVCSLFKNTNKTNKQELAASILFYKIIYTVTAFIKNLNY
jgi:hypothetical protein